MTNAAHIAYRNDRVVKFAPRDEAVLFALKRGEHSELWSIASVADVLAARAKSNKPA